jgi:RNA polymerase sigma factor (sigma-70 family)
MGKQMNVGKPAPLVRQLRQLTQEAATLCDAQLLDQFLQGDEGAFETLVRRHGPMVLAVCRRVLHDAHDAEDAFQACFLVLVRKAASIGRRELLANWLYGVAYRTAMKARSAAHTRKWKESQVMPKTIANPAEARPDWLPLLDQELSALPRKYRMAIVLCDLEGHTRRQAARQLDLPEKTLATHLARGRGMLAKRLARHGLILSGAGILASNLASAAVPGPLFGATIQAARFSTARQALAAGAISATTATLSESVLRSMMMTRFRIVTMVLMALGIVGITAELCRGGGWMLTDSKSADVERGPSAAGLIKVPSPYDGILQCLVGAEIAEGEAVPKDAVTVQGKKFRRLKKGDAVKAGQLLALLDDRPARAELAIRQAKIRVAEADLAAAEATCEEARIRFETSLKLLKKACMAVDDVRERKLVFDRYTFEMKSKKEAVELTRLDVVLAQTLVEMHEIRSPADGVIKNIHRHTGEAVRALETVFELTASTE